MTLLLGLGALGAGESDMGESVVGEVGRLALRLLPTAYEDSLGGAGCCRGSAGSAGSCYVGALSAEFVESNRECCGLGRRIV